MAANANIIITQEPYYRTLPVGQEIIFTVQDDNIVANQTRVRFTASIYLSADTSSITTAASLVATLKTTPNGNGVAMFDIRPVLESYVNPEQLANGQDSGEYSGVVNSTFKGVDFIDKTFPIHVVDKFSQANEVARAFRVLFAVEYLSGNATVVDSNKEWSEEYLVFNGYVKNEDIYTSKKTPYGINYGLDLENMQQQVFINNRTTTPFDVSIIQSSGTAKFLTSAPTQQYARLKDYGTIAMFNKLDRSFTTAPGIVGNQVDRIRVSLFNSATVQLGSDIDIQNTTTAGGTRRSNYDQLVKQNILFFGIYPANFDGGYIKDPVTYADWNTHKANVALYKFKAIDSSGNDLTQSYTVDILCNESRKGYENIRLCWLNRWGAWDYYTFTLKNTRSFTTNRTKYTQLGGTWNARNYEPVGYKGGQKTFRVNNTERITLNTDYMTDEESIWIEELINSPEVYIINGFSTDANASSTTLSGIVNKYVEPVLLTTSNFVRKLSGNEKLIQYTIDIERNKTQRTQAI
tara:strand:- start:327 stop:1886 length:1560 start_codon:yes stop_codon:yes gene_type:complete